MIELFIGVLSGVAIAVAIHFYYFSKWQDANRETLERNRYGRSQGVAPLPVPPYERPVMMMMLGFFLPVISMLLFACFTVISAGHAGVQVTMGTVNPEPLTEGVHFVNPISNIKSVSVRLDSATLKGANAGTKDLQVVHTDIVVNYRLDGKKVAHIYKDFGFDVDTKVLLPAINESFKAVTAHYDSEELITKRDMVSQGIKEELQQKVGKYGIGINEISLVNFGFSSEYQNAIEQKVIATQSKLKAEQDLQRIKVEAQQAIAKAQGDAEAIRISAQAIQNQGGEAYVKLKAVEKWDGKLPFYTGGTMPMLNLNQPK